MEHSPEALQEAEPHLRHVERDNRSHDELQIPQNFETRPNTNDGQSDTPDEHPADADDGPAISDNESIASDGSDDSEMEPFSEYQAKIEQLLLDVGLVDVTIAELQHGYSFQNCVYALTSRQDPEEQYVLRVPVCPNLDRASNKCTDIFQSVALLEYLAINLPVQVPHIKAYSVTANNALSTPFTIQTRLPGTSLNNVYGDLIHDDKLGIIDQVIQLILQLEKIEFLTAGTFEPSSPLADSQNDYTSNAGLTILPFNEGDQAFTKEPASIQARTGSNLKSFLTNHLEGWIAHDLNKEPESESLTVPSLKKMLAMLSTFDNEETFPNHPHPIILHHCDLEPRNIMVQHLNGSWKITGVIDWDEALALPVPLARQPPNWIWDFDAEGYTGYFNTDFQPTLDMSAEDAVLKAYFDAGISGVIDGYLEDAVVEYVLLELNEKMMEEWDERVEGVARVAEGATVEEGDAQKLTGGVIEAANSCPGFPGSPSPVDSKGRAPYYRKMLDWVRDLVWGFRS
ncbi:MAG: hypothetical protein Q9170_002704 [Blastenia crenularia]